MKQFALFAIRLYLGLSATADDGVAPTLTTLHSFSGPDGSAPRAALVLGRDGNFCGTTQNGGSMGLGTGVGDQARLLRRGVYLRLGGVRAAIPPDVSRMAARGGEQVR